jgi:hypothetical protein
MLLSFIVPIKFPRVWEVSWKLAGVRLTGWRSHTRREHHRYPSPDPAGAAAEPDPAPDAELTRSGGVVLVMQRIEDYQPPAWPGTSIVHLDLNGDAQVGELERRAAAVGARPRQCAVSGLTREAGMPNRRLRSRRGPPRRTRRCWHRRSPGIPCL